LGGVVRTRATARAAGAKFERVVADYLAATVDDRVDRRVKTGNKDRGDITGLRYFGARVVVEVKDYGGQYEVGTWLTEVDIERGNDDAQVGAVVVKRRGISDPGDQAVLMTVRDLVALLTGERPA
jgi:hypothetical protein